MADHTVRVMVITPLGEGGRGGIDRIMDEVRRHLAVSPPSGLQASFLATRGQGHLVVSPLRMAWALGQMVTKRWGDQLDVVHVNLSSHGSTLRKLIICWTAQKLRLPYIVHLHGSRFRQYWDAADPFVARRIADMFRGATRVLVLGEVWREYISSRVPACGDRIEVLPNACAAVRTQPPLEERDTVTILFLGRLGGRKGTPQLIEALAQLPKDRLWRSVLSGDGEVEPTREHLARLGLLDRVTLTGWVGPNEVGRLLSTSDVLVLPSFDENLPMSVIEGMANGLAVVTTPVGATPDIVQHEVTGLLVPAGDVTALAQALARLVYDVNLRQRLGINAKAFHLAHLEITAYTERLFSIWRKAAAANVQRDR